MTFSWYNAVKTISDYFQKEYQSMASLLLPIIYLAFISLGLPDALLGAAWPTMYPQLGAPWRATA